MKYLAALMILASLTLACPTKAGDWVLGFKYDDTKMAEGRPINRHDLDEAAPNNPVFIRHRGGHTAIYNSLVSQYGITQAGNILRADILSPLAVSASRCSGR
jgi:predicted amidohydrolase YtcJ